MATITKPSSPGWSRVVSHYHKVTARYQSPFTLQAQTQLYSGEQWSFDLSLPSMNATDAAAWLTFLHELARDNDNFSLVVTGYVPSGVSSPMLVRLILPTVTWDIDETMRYGITFSVEQDI